MRQQLVKSFLRVKCVAKNVQYRSLYNVSISLTTDSLYLVKLNRKTLNVTDLVTYSYSVSVECSVHCTVYWDYCPCR